jgi:hypothetical protein
MDLKFHESEGKDGLILFGLICYNVTISVPFYFYF